jgi:receptor-type tyrosine-protein phosphatase gamma
VIREIELPIPLREFYHESKYRNLDLEYQLLSKITETEKHLQMLVDTDPETSSQNRYNDVIPYKDNLVPITNWTYFNGSFVSGSVPDHEELFIATQGPLNWTVPKFLQMIFDYGVGLVVMTW